MSKTLNEAIAARTAARAKLAAAQDATAHGRSTVNAARAEVERLADDEAQWIERHAKRLEERARSGKEGAPDLVPTDKAIIAKRTAEVTLVAAEQAFKALEAAEQSARTQLQAVENRLSQVKLERKRVKVEALAQRLKAVRDHEWELCALLAAVDLDDSAAMTQLARDSFLRARTRPTIEDFLGGHVLHDVNSPRGGDPALTTARRFWQEFNEQVDDEPAEQQDNAA